MQRIHQLIFVGSLLALSWQVMMALHELGHVVGATVSGGHVERVVLHPLAISRTDVSPNPFPSIVVWLGPTLGSAFPITAWLLIPRRLEALRNIVLFFAGFCLIANGAYIAIGAFDQVGDCRVMLQNGSPMWLLIAFGTVTIPLGFYCWHRLGSAKTFLADPTKVDPIFAYVLLAIFAVTVMLELALSPGSL